MTGPKTFTGDDYDVEEAVRTMTRARRRKHQLVTVEIATADRMAQSIIDATPTESLEATGLALVRGASMLGGLLQEVIGELDEKTQATAWALVNIQGFAGERIVRDARAIDQAGL